MTSKYEQLRVCYYGAADWESMEEIKKNGFPPNSYFYLHREDAMAYF